MYTAQAEVPSEKAARYLAQLCKHFAHKVPVDWDTTAGQVDFGSGTCHMWVRDDRLFLDCRAPTDDELARVKFIVEDHLVRFGWKENLRLDWSSAG